MTQIKELAQSLNMNERELVEYIQSVGRVLNENFMRDVFDDWLNKVAIEYGIKRRFFETNSKLRARITKLVMKIKFRIEDL